jgi:hypothetical protein
MTKKDFKTRCDLNHVYGRGAKRINTVYVDWKSDETGRGFKYAAATSVENCTKAELFNLVYDWIENGVYLPYYVYSKVAQYDNQRFKTPISFNPNSWN